MRGCPNILWIQTDEQRPDSLGCYGAAWAKTPALDGLARRGVVMRRAFCQSPVCVPSRASQLTCRYPQEVNCLSNVVAERPQVFPEGTLTFPEVFQAAGYETVNIGKTHLPDHPAWERNERIPMQYVRGEERDAAASETGQALRESPHWGASRHPEGSQSRLITDRAIEFLHARERSRPFLLRVSHIWPHTPVRPPRPFDCCYEPKEIPIVPFDPEALACRSARDRAIAAPNRVAELSAGEYEKIWTHYMGLVAYVDHEIARLLAALKDLGIEHDTVVMFSSDHGKSLGEWGRLGKMVFDDPVWRVPLIFSWPGRLPEGESRDEFCGLLDTGRTLLGLAGLAHLAPTSFRGRDLFRDPGPQAVFGQIGIPHRQAPLIQRDEAIRAEVARRPRGPQDAMRVAIRTARYRMDISWMREGRRLRPEEQDGDLFDLENDPLEKQNLWPAPQARPVVEDLRARLAAFMDGLSFPAESFGLAQ